jgi:dipeptidyl aminopeptidase/acylaminoacyl peptidase
VNARSAPIFMIHGSSDRMVPVASSRYMADTLEQNLRPYSYIEIENADHGFEIFEPGSPYKPAICSMLSFLHQTLGAN